MTCFLADACGTKREKIEVIFKRQDFHKLEVGSLLNIEGVSHVKKAKMSYKFGSHIFKTIIGKKNLHVFPGTKQLQLFMSKRCCFFKLNK